MSNITDYVVFNDEKLSRKYSNEAIPMSALYEAYFDGDLDIKTDVLEFLQQRQAFVKYTITRQHLQWAVTNFVPDLVHTRSQDERLVREVYDRGNDFFEWFLGRNMSYSSAYFSAPGEDLEQAQANQSARILDKLALGPEDTLLDVGCGWGGMLRDAVEKGVASATGISLADKQVRFATQLLENAKCQDRAQALRQDYRDLPSEAQYSRLICLEMIEQVGLKNLGGFCERLHQLLKDDGLLFIQWTGVRRNLRQEDLMWGLFISKYIFPGSDASLPPSAMLKSLEKAGFELKSVENISSHYAKTLRAWRSNWLSNKEAILASYGERWFRIWNFFLSWSILIADQGSASCYQAVLVKRASTTSGGESLPAPPSLEQ